MPWIQEALKQGGLFAVAVICLAGTIATARIFLWVYRRTTDRVDVLVDRSHEKSEKDMQVIAGLQRTVDKQADATEAVADQVEAVSRRLDKLCDVVADLKAELRPPQRKAGANEG